ncbi:endonuclease/exonuclease/phosphatase family protein [Alistipes timonensis]|uniref:endonuclease/exonuclease/phosphatase family protein n=1 Tax=Alistipes timonensis TaxID=1465754 RepID=UPI001C3E48A4|nr:endonuclease/exonuclease/phosphatase family protein [Alistipes timonensis]MCR2029783.1 endonuclease/exonuclease/phosphatase family protein [Alistipes timonensis]
MKPNLYTKMFLCGTLLLAGACSDDDEKPKKSTNISVVSFNIRVDNPVDGDNVWENRKAAAVTMIEYEQPTLIGLQEAQPHQITYLAKNCPDYAWYGLGRDTGECPPETDSYAAEECMAIFYKTSEVELLDKGTFWLSPTPDVPSKGWDAGYNRSCTWGFFRHKPSGRNFYFLNTHLDNSGTEARKRSLQLIAEKAKEFNSEAHPMFLTADFNSDTDETIFAPLFRVMHDARKLATITDDRATFNGYKETATRKLDHIFFSNCLAYRFKTLTQNYGAPYISDHYPIKGLFVIPRTK